MSLSPSVSGPVPEETARIARAAFPKGNLYLKLRDELGVLFEDRDFIELFSKRGHPSYAPWCLALITVLQFLENLSDRPAAEAVRSRIDWKYLLGLELSDAGFDYSVLSGFRERLVSNRKQELLLDRLLELLREKKLLKERGKQRTDSTHVLAAIRVMNRVELVKIRFGAQDCLSCSSRAKCVRAPKAGRSLQLPARQLHEALTKTRRKLASEAGREEYKRRAGVEGTISQATRRGAARRSRYRGLEKTHLQEVAAATGINLLRTVAFLSGQEIAKTRVSRFKRLAN